MSKLRLIHNSAIFILIWNGLPALATVYDSDGSSTNIQYIHDTLAHDGDTIQLPAGTFIWNTQVHIVKNITLQGSRQGATTINDNVPKNGGGGSVMLLCDGITGNLRITGFTVHGQAQDTNVYNKGTIAVGGTSHSVRIDHISIIQPGTGAFVINGVWGVADHCTLDDSNFKQGFQVFGTDFADADWEAPTNLGSGEGWYIEDCTFTGSGTAGAGVTDATRGGRFVFRYNTVTSDNAATHGTESQRYRGVRSYEFYQNTFTNPSTIMFCAIYLRGGTGVVWGNTIRGGAGQTGYRNAILASNYRVGNTWQPWGRWASVWDGPNSGYPGLDQVGQGQCLDQVRGDPPINQRTGNAAWPRNQFEPVYAWSNNWTPVPNNPGSYIGSQQSVIQPGRDIIDNGNAQKPNYTPFIYPHPLVTDPPMPSPTPSATATPTPTPSPTSQPSPTPSPAPSPTPTSTPAATLTPTPTPQPSSTPRATPTATPSPSVTPTATPTPTPRQITLGARGYLLNGRRRADLSWSGATSNRVDLYRHGVLIATPTNNGFYTDRIGGRGPGSFTYRVCNTGTQTCSNQATVTF